MNEDEIRLGDRVRLLNGEFEGFEAGVIEVEDTESLRVLVNVFGRDIVTQISQSEVRPALRIRSRDSSDRNVM